MSISLSFHHVFCSEGLLTEVELITFTGFSLGGSIAHALAFLFREVLYLRSMKFRVIGFGCPRPGSELFSDWFRRELQLDSCNIILHDEEMIEEDNATATAGGAKASIHPIYDPAPLHPPRKNGFDFHPNCFILHRRFGTLRPLGWLEKSHIDEIAEKVRYNIHSIIYTHQHYN